MFFQQQSAAALYGSKSKPKRATQRPFGADDMVLGVCKYRPIRHDSAIRASSDLVPGPAFRQLVVVEAQ
ncbi:hypothetical protein DAPPUDRAFT_233722 [Daphnia pulex]|uniref:Uncharacterized protein n=1 Tax=Daphnia pulex TaxID=6669 RepID=E9FVJ6_DAPPU|nr:hypothetical protein DAPPUDRAFT_233722 [Daphnia pulex]|eukprot:EFX88565.1 hypothetical protein DAPPUDRAFT_233722 [Daphnia pulex]